VSNVVSNAIVNHRNEKAARRYQELVTTLTLLTDALVPLERLIARMGSERDWSAGGWRVASPDELTHLIAKVHNDLTALKSHARKHRAELMSQEWST
jgi:hypothetical protein